MINDDTPSFIREAAAGDESKYVDLAKAKAALSGGKLQMADVINTSRVVKDLQAEKFTNVQLD